MLSHVASMRALQGVQSMMRNAMGSTQVALGSNISGGSMGKAWADKEHAQENQYFSKQDAQNLAKLAEKLHLQTAPNEKLITVAKNELIDILGKHGVGVTDSLVDDILKFKFNKA